MKNDGVLFLTRDVDCIALYIASPEVPVITGGKQQWDEGNNPIFIPPSVLHATFPKSLHIRKGSKAIKRFKIVPIKED